MNRRHFLRMGVASALAFGASPSLAALTQQGERSLAFLNTHTGERIKTVYWQDGDYIKAGLSDINRVLRDHRSGEVYPMDPRLLDMLHLLHQQVEGRHAFQVISGYRSPKTNAKLANKSSGVARRSLHMRGKAIDIRLSGVQLKHLRKAALSLRAGGVGYYPNSNFIHVDTGRVRRW